LKLWAFLLAFTLCATMQGQQPMSDFVLNPSKPYVYLQFDHVGPRKPLREGEGNVGLWLRIVNNCREPITVPTFGLSSGDPGVGVLDEVVPDILTMSVTADSGGINVSEGAASTAVPVSPKNSPPQGYSAEVSSMTRVLPGKDMLFSVPLNHVSDKWFMRVRFVLDVNKPSVGTGPYTYLDFFKTQIPPGTLAGAAIKPGSSESTLLHESGHIDPTSQH
jgi:hypothetical protein